jgi:hypothetical protein
MEVLSREVLGSFQEKLPLGSELTTIPAPDFAEFLQARGYLRSDLHLTNAGGPFYLVVNRHLALGREGRDVKAHGQLLTNYRKEGIPLAELWYYPHGAAPVEQ